MKAKTKPECPYCGITFDQWTNYAWHLGKAHAEKIDGL